MAFLKHIAIMALMAGLGLAFAYGLAVGVAVVFIP